jgi:ABC-2 type transport system ATP-binding protein
MGDNPTVAAHELRKRYGARAALDGVSFNVAAGEIVGLLGPNGAGKTTTLSILAGVAAPDSGRVSVCGHDLAREPRAARRALGLVPQSLALYPSLTARENLGFFGRIQGLCAREARERTNRLLDAVGLADRAADRVSTFSGGMLRRLNLACGMIHDPAVLLLDEATAGVDPQSRERIFGVVAARAAERGTSVLYSTHYMEEVERLCARVVLIDHGRVVADDTVSEIVARAGSEPRLELFTERPLAAGWSHGLGGVREIRFGSRGANGAALALPSIDLVPAVLRLASEAGGSVSEFRVHKPNLQDAFIALTGHALRDEL